MGGFLLPILGNNMLLHDIHIVPGSSFSIISINKKFKTKFKLGSNFFLSNIIAMFNCTRTECIYVIADVRFFSIGNSYKIVNERKTVMLILPSKFPGGVNLDTCGPNPADIFINKALKSLDRIKKQFISKTYFSYSETDKLSIKYPIIIAKPITIDINSSIALSNVWVQSVLDNSLIQKVFHSNILNDKLFSGNSFIDKELLLCTQKDEYGLLKIVAEANLSKRTIRHFLNIFYSSKRKKILGERSYDSNLTKSIYELQLLINKLKYHFVFVILKSKTGKFYTDYYRNFCAYVFNFNGTLDICSNVVDYINVFNEPHDSVKKLVTKVSAITASKIYKKLKFTKSVIGL